MWKGADDSSKGRKICKIPRKMKQNEAPSVEIRTTAARLALEDGSVFHGEAFGDLSPKTVDAEICFNTSITGYQEILTDPSYSGQIVTMTYPLIGNYGTNDVDLESEKIQTRGFIVRELANLTSNFRSTKKLEEWLESQGVTGITGIDTRALTRKLRINGSMNGVLSTDSAKSDADLVKEAKEAPGLVGINLAKGVSRGETLHWEEDLGDWAPIQGEIERPTNQFRVVAIDCGAKLNILRNLTDSGCDVIVVPWNASADEILKHEPNGIFVSNGPGDPAAVTETVETVKALHGKLPIFGICLGHQILCLSMGAETYKLKFGHRGGNQPVQNLETGKVEITSQNHGFAVDTESLEAVGAEATHINLNDRTLAGFRHNELPIFAIQYHPEASPGPHDSRYLFDCFIEMMQTGKSPTGEQMDQAQRRRNEMK